MEKLTITNLLEKSRKWLPAAIFVFSMIYAQAQTGGFANVSSGGTSVTVTNTSQFLDYISRSGSYIINVDGTINLSGMNDVASDKTIQGVGTNGRIVGGGLDIDGVNNVVIRNIAFSDWDDDAINIQDGSTNIWVDHCDFTNGYDGAVDVKRGSDFVTVSWNHFYNHGKTCLLGHSDNNGSQDIGHLRVTYHHNYFDGTGSRHPRVRFSALCHVYNNYYRDNDYGVASTQDAEVLVENNYFQDCGDPTLVGYGSSSDGDLVQRNNVFAGSTGSPETRGSVPNPPYSYSLDNANDIPGIVSANAGVGGGGGNNGGGGNDDGPTCGTCGSGIVNGGVYRIIPRHAQSKALEVYNFDPNNGANVNQWEYWGGDFQHWIATDRGGGYWSFHPVPASGRAMDVFEVSTADGANINIWDYWGGEGQQWYFSNAGSGGWVRIKSRLSGKCLDVENLSTADGANVMQWTCISGNQNQMFRFESVGGSRLDGSFESSEINADALEVYPNPVQDVLNIRLSSQLQGTTRVSLFNTSGQLIGLTSAEGSSQRLDMSKLPKGVYFIRIENGGTIAQRKLIKE